MKSAGCRWQPALEGHRPPWVLASESIDCHAGELSATASTASSESSSTRYEMFTY